MITASAKKKENIAEYLLYMWQIEDLIRANDLDIDKIQANIIDHYTNLTDAQRKEMREWYESLIDMMRREDVVKSGHLQINKNVILALEDLHRRLMADPKYATYNAQFYATLPYIVEIRAKAGDNKKDEIESCFDALYGMLLLRLQGKEVSEETLKAMQQISKYLAVLSHYYKKDFNNELFNDN
ncbi:MAG: DUF4924 family protein [Muribaculaceae bacterium]|nr:DUF4924 family protein [Bacteroides sp.]MDE6803724.1 DUF4924 family protein [Muribaculaceae bacterium]MDE6843649.1 DUF4924 family protein [Muribaculaceae bacterium]